MDAGNPVLPLRDQPATTGLPLATQTVVAVTIPSALSAKITALRAALETMQTKPRDGELVDRLKALASDLADAAKDLERVRQITKLLMAEELGLPDAS